jgi:hypothetical protein
MPAGALGHCARATASRDLVQGQKALAAASMAGAQGQVAQILPCLAPTFMVNTQHQAEPRPQKNPHMAIATAAPSTLTTGLKLDAV